MSRILQRGQMTTPLQITDGPPQTSSSNQTSFNQQGDLKMEEKGGQTAASSLTSQQNKVRTGTIFNPMFADLVSVFSSRHGAGKHQFLPQTGVHTLPSARVLDLRRHILSTCK